MIELPAWVQRVVEVLKRELAGSAAPPESTYRLQLARETMTYRLAAEVVPYLHELGVSHLYTSPDRKAQSGSRAYGYAIVDYDSLISRSWAAAPEDYQALVAALRTAGMGRIPDIVPNHMSATPGENPYWCGPDRVGERVCRLLALCRRTSISNWDPVKEEHP